MAHYVSCVMCHVSHVTCPKKFENFFLLLLILKKIGQSGGASRWRVCYPQGLPRQVFYSLGKTWQKGGERGQKEKFMWVLSGSYIPMLILNYLVRLNFFYHQ